MRIVIEKLEIPVFDGVKLEKIDWTIGSEWAIVEWTYLGKPSQNKFSFNTKEGTFRVANLKDDRLVLAAKNGEAGIRRIFKNLEEAVRTIPA